MKISSTLMRLSVFAVALLACASVIATSLVSHAAGVQAAVNMNCTVIVPANPLTAQGLATPYKLLATDQDKGACHEANPNQSVFVQAAVLDPATGAISIYSPLVVDRGTQPAIAPVVPQLPANAVVAIWFGGNDNVTTLRGDTGGGNCVNGLRGSPFGQFAYCNAPNFFQAAHTAINMGLLQVPSLGVANDGMTCPSTRDFSIVDQDQSDNVQTMYLAKNGRTAQDTAANRAQLGGAVTLINPSDNLVLTNFVDPALGCTPWTAPDLADPGHSVPALPLDELQAMGQPAPVAFVPLGDPMAQVNGHSSLHKVNAYRAGVDQPMAMNQAEASTKTYCANLRSIPGIGRVKLDRQFTINGPTPAPAVGTNLFAFLASRYVTAYQLLNCQKLLGKKDPVKLILNGNGVAVDAIITL